MSNGKRRLPVSAKGYSEGGASLTRRSLRGFNPTSGSPNEDINDNGSTLRQRSRMLYMAAPLATSAINTNRTKVVGTGLVLKCAIDRDVLGLTEQQAKDWQRQTEAEWRMWAENRANCDALGLNNFYALQQVAIKSWLMSGDVFAVIQREKPTPLNPYSIRIHLVEADRVSTPYEFGGSLSYNGITDGKNTDNGNRIFDGVEVSSAGRVLAYHIRNTYPFQRTMEETVWTRVEAIGEKTGLPNILHIMDCERPDQYRGVPYLAQVIEPLLQLRQYTASELMAALVQSFFTAWVKTETTQSDIPFNETGAGDVPSENPGDNISDDSSEYEMGPGTVTHLKDGEDIVFGNPNIPTAGFETFVKTVAKMCGAALEIPYDVLVKEFNASYSASRGALLEAWEAIRMRRVWLADDFCQPVYTAWLAEAVARGRIKAPGFWDDPLLRAAWCGARWIGPVQGQLDPKKEAEANIELIDRGIKTHEQVTMETSGGDWYENVEQLRRENEALSAAGGGRVQRVPAEPEENDETEESENEQTQ